VNIFYVDSDPTLAAQMLCDRHVVKMIIESAQLLSTAHRVVDGYDGPGVYRLTHKNHPSAVWVRDSLWAYNWTAEHFESLMQEYTFRYGKIHATEKFQNIWDNFLSRPPMNIPKVYASSDPPQCMPEKYRGPDTVEAYRAYYIGEKARFARWTKRPMPEWYASAFT
jgi:Pyrimidine dimer DNA glycosylase